MNWEPFLTCALTGAGDSAGKHPGLPITPEHVADAALEAAAAGAAIVHVHVREPATGQGSRKPEYFREVVERIRASKVDVVVNLTTGMGGDLVVGPQGEADTPAPGSDFVGALERMVHVEELEPEIASMDCGTMNFSDADTIYVMTPNYLRAQAKRFQELRVKPEMEVFDLGHIELAKVLQREGLIDTAPLFQLCMGLTYGAPATPEALLALRDHLPEGAHWSGFAIGRMEMPFVAQVALLGGNLRVGLEDNLYLGKGNLASNGQLVARAKEIIEAMGGRLASPQEARDRLGLVSRH